MFNGHRADSRWRRASVRLDGMFGEQSDGLVTGKVTPGVAQHDALGAAHLGADGMIAALGLQDHEILAALDSRLQPPAVDLDCQLIASCRPGETATLTATESGAYRDESGAGAVIAQDW